MRHLNKDGSDARKRVGFEATKAGDGSRAMRDAAAAAEAAEARRRQLRRSKQAAAKDEDAEPEVVDPGRRSKKADVVKQKRSESMEPAPRLPPEQTFYKDARLRGATDEEVAEAAGSDEHVDASDLAPGEKTAEGEEHFGKWPSVKMVSKLSAICSASEERGSVPAKIAVNDSSRGFVAVRAILAATELGGRCRHINEDDLFEIKNTILTECEWLVGVTIDCDTRWPHVRKRDRGAYCDAAKFAKRLIWCEMALRMTLLLTGQETREQWKELMMMMSHKVAGTTDDEAKAGAPEATQPVDPRTARFFEVGLAVSVGESDGASAASAATAARQRTISEVYREWKKKSNFDSDGGGRMQARADKRADVTTFIVHVTGNADAEHKIPAPDFVSSDLELPGAWYYYATRMNSDAMQQMAEELFGLEQVEGLSEEAREWGRAVIRQCGFRTPKVEVLEALLTAVMPHADMATRLRLARQPAGARGSVQVRSERMGWASSFGTAEEVRLAFHGRLQRIVHEAVHTNAARGADSRSPFKKKASRRAAATSDIDDDDDGGDDSDTGDGGDGTDDGDDDYEESQGARAERGTQGPPKRATGSGNAGGGGAVGDGDDDDDGDSSMFSSPTSGRGTPTGHAAQDSERARWERFVEFERREREEEARAASGGNEGGLPGLPHFDDDDNDSADGNGSVTSRSDDDGGDARMGHGGRHAGGAPRRAGAATAGEIANDVTSADRLANALENWTATGQTPTGLTPDENRTLNKMIKLGKSERPAMEMTLAARNAIPGALTQLAGRDADLAPMGVPSGVCKLLERAAAVLATQHRYPPRAQLAMWINGLTSKTSGFNPATFQTVVDDDASSGVSQRQRDVWADAKDAAGKSCKTMVRWSPTFKPVTDLETFRDVMKGLEEAHLHAAIEMSDGFDRFVGYLVKFRTDNNGRYTWDEVVEDFLERAHEKAKELNEFALGVTEELPPWHSLPVELGLRHQFKAEAEKAYLRLWKRNQQQETATSSGGGGDGGGSGSGGGGGGGGGAAGGKPKDKKGDKKAAAADKQKAKEALAKARDADKAPKPPKKPCSEWKRSGTCSWGDSCRFAHDDVVQTGGGGATAGGGAAGNGTQDWDAAWASRASKQPGEPEQRVPCGTMIAESWIMVYSRWRICSQTAGCCWARHARARKDCNCYLCQKSKKWPALLDAKLKPPGWEGG